jgi:tol-pal system-associated acyl-CoA thioesterase
MSSATVRHPVRVAYVDTDQGGIVHHSIYLRYCEQARVEWLRAHGLAYRALEYDHHFALPVASVKLKYRRPAHFDDLLEVACSLGQLGHASLRFDYRIERDHQLLVEAETVLACVRLPEMRATRLPDFLRRACGDGDPAS